MSGSPPPPAPTPWRWTTASVPNGLRRTCSAPAPAVFAAHVSRRTGLAALTLFAALMVALRPRVVYARAVQAAPSQTLAKVAGLALVLLCGAAIMAPRPAMAHAASSDAAALIASSIKATKRAA